MEAIGSSTWTGTWKEGHGDISARSKALSKVAYSYATRFVDDGGVGPEELLASAHAGCYNQALANNFGMIDLKADSISTHVSVQFGIDDDGHPFIKGSHITTQAKVSGITQAQFDHCAERARIGCTISKVFKGDIGLTASLLS